ncbi:MAG: guanylate kinase [Burkholderiaceae bacterium]|nr:guanylate kinase [Burkholderiaceae bacterium]
MMQKAIPKGRLIVISAPSGAGKTSLISALLKSHGARLQLSVSTTTRPPRPGEEHGKDYFFCEKDVFAKRIEDGAFLEWAFVHGNYYGTSRQWIEEQLARGGFVLLEIDWQGAQQIRAQFPREQVVSIFIRPPTVEALRQRLIDRGKDSVEVIEERLRAAKEELTHADEFDYVIMNQEFATALRDLSQLVSQVVSTPA